MRSKYRKKERNLLIITDLGEAISRRYLTQRHKEHKEKARRIKADTEETRGVKCCSSCRRQFHAGISHKGTESTKRKPGG